MPASASAVAIPPFIAFVVAVLVIGLLLRSRAAALVLDHPNQRSLHSAPTPRLGGLGILAGIAAGCAYAGVAVDPRIVIALALVTVISLFDDVFNLGVTWRMLAHLAAAGLAASVYVYHEHGLWTALAALLAVAWMTNLFNFMDGSDGLAGGMAACGFGSYGIAAWWANEPVFAALNLAVAAAAAGFLVYNFPPARVFMGDAGSIPLGFLAAVCGLAGWQSGAWPWWFGLMVFSPFIVDATTTLAKRLLRGAKVWQAHREHYYQRLIQAGWGHRKTLYAECGLMGVVCAAALAARGLDSTARNFVVLAIVALYALMIAVLERRLRAPALQNV
jgi:UDP-N-acetylmuramyl pentapeptide phosphotransferase/UDP-N-acetylglucosamine-1-phosphate transferase